MGKEQKLPSSMSLHKCPEAGMKYIKGLSSHFKTRIKGLNLSDSISRSKVHGFLPQTSGQEVDSLTLNQAENVSQVCLPFLGCSSTVLKLTTKNNHHKY